MGVLYLKGIGVKRDVKLACQYFMVAANAGQPKAFYQLAKMFHTGIGFKKDLTMVNSVLEFFFLKIYYRVCVYSVGQLVYIF